MRAFITNQDAAMIAGQCQGKGDRHEETDQEDKTA